MKKNIKSKGYSVLLSCLSICAVPAQQLISSVVQKNSSNLGTDVIGRFFNDQFFKLNINNNKNIFKTEVSPKIYETKSNLHPGLPPAIVEDESRSCEITKINISESDVFDTNRFVPVINLKFSTTSDAEDYFDSSKNNPSTLQQIVKSNILPSDGAGIQLMIYDKLKNDLADLCIYEKNELITRRDFEIVSKNNTSPITKTPFCFKVGIQEDGFLFCDAQLKNSIGYNVNVKFKLGIKSTDISLKFIDTTKNLFKHFELNSNITNQNIFNETTCSISRGNTSDNFNLRKQEIGKISSDLTISSLNNISSLDCPPVSSISFDEKFLESSVYSGTTYLDIPIEHIIIRQINGELFSNEQVADFLKQSTFEKQTNNCIDFSISEFAAKPFSYNDIKTKSFYIYKDIRRDYLSVENWEFDIENNSNEYKTILEAEKNPLPSISFIKDDSSIKGIRIENWFWNGENPISLNETEKISSTYNGKQMSKNKYICDPLHEFNINIKYCWYGSEKINLPSIHMFDYEGPGKDINHDNGFPYQMLMNEVWVKDYNLKPMRII